VSSAADAQLRRTVLILLEEPHAWLAAATLARKAPQGSIETLISPVPGVGFLAATGQEAVDLDAWWSRMATTPGRAVVIAAHEDDLLRWIPGADADFVVAVPDEATLAAYQHLPNVQATVSDDPRQLAEVALSHVGLAPAPEPVSEPAAQIAPTPAPEDSRPPEPEPQVEWRTAIDPFELISRAQALEVGPESNGGLRPEAFGAHTIAVSPPPSPGQAKPRVPAAVSEPQAHAVASPSHPGSRGGLDPRQILDRLGQGRRAPVSAELGKAVLACKPIVAAVVSRKGGVGKTASAAAVAAILGEAVDPFGHTAALVDANIGNPDAWGRLDVSGEPTTMREIVGRLMSGREPPGPAFAQTPALAVYPESREAGDGYAPAQIQRVATYLKTRHAAVIVDLPNRLPAFTSAEAAVAAAWIGEADVLVLPTTADPTALLGAIEYLDADSVQGKPVVVSYIVPRARQIRDAPQVRGMLDRIRAGVSALVEVPDDDRATLALIQRVAITEVANELRYAYVSLATRVVEAAASRNRRPT
jgi:MinD-like ATPase involved in chromosome partitioning or flagellar assembly